MVLLNSEDDIIELKKIEIKNSVYNISINKMKNMQALDTFLRQRFSKKGEGCTHTRIGDSARGIGGGAFTVSDADKDQFFRKYHSHVFDNGNAEYLTEKQLPDAGPILIDLDFRYATDVETRQHNEEHIMAFIELYCENITKIVNVSKDTAIPIFVFEKSTVNILDEVTKDGIHIIIGIHMDRTLQILLRKLVLDDIEDRNIDLPLINKWDEVIDDGIAKGHTNWQLYGSRKPGHKAYMLTHKFDLSVDEDRDWSAEEDKMTNFDLKKNFHTLSAQYSKHIKFDMLESIKDEYEKIKENKGKIKKKKLKIISKNTVVAIEDIKSKEQLETAVDAFLEEVKEDVSKYNILETHDYAMSLPESYYGPGSFNKWIRVGWALKNTSTKLFLVWLKFVSRDNCRNTLKDSTGKFDWNNVLELYDMWKNFQYNNADGLTNRSIMYWSKNDAFEKYKEIYKQTIEHSIEKTVNEPTSNTEFDLASVLYNIYKTRFVCVSIKNNIWYEFVDNRWLEIDSGSTLRLLISQDMHNIYLGRVRVLPNIIQKTDATDPEYNKLHKRTQRLSEICISLKKTQSKNNIMREARELFYDKDFLNNLDTKTHLLCFKNGVVDFEEKIFRRGQPDDNISKCTNIDYISTIKDTNSLKEINNFMEQLFPIEKLRKYMWEHLASCLIGTNSEQTFNIYTGSGSNGKSKLVELMGYCLGEYKATVPITLITQKRNSIGSTSSEIVQLMGTRYAVMQEPSKGDRINEGIMKEITGGDPIQGRALFKDTVTFIPQFKLVVCTNSLFDIKSNDDGTWRRIRVCDFKAKFCENPLIDNEEEPYQFKIDKHMEGKIKKWAPIFISMLVSKAFEKNGDVTSCDIVMASSDKYRDGQDYLAEFVKENIREAQGSHIKKTGVYTQFQEWYKLQYGRSVPPRRELHEYLDKKFGKHNSKINGWKDIEFIEPDEE